MRQLNRPIRLTDRVFWTDEEAEANGVASLTFGSSHGLGNITIGYAGSSAGFLAQTPPPPGFRGYFDVFGIQVPVARELYDDFTVPRLQEKLEAIKSFVPMSAKQSEQQQNAIAALNQFISIRQAKDLARELAKDLTKFFEEFTPKDIPPPDQNIDPLSDAGATGVAGVAGLGSVGPGSSSSGVPGQADNSPNSDTSGVGPDGGEW